MDEDSTEAVKRAEAAEERRRRVHLILSWLNEKWPENHRSCPVCGVNDWIAEDITFELPGRMEFGGSGKAMPVVPIVCKNCGNTLFFNAVFMGLSPPFEERGPGEPQE